jgi:hypothetical protein
VDASQPEQFVVRLAFWPTWLGLVVKSQLLLLAVAVCSIALRGLAGSALLDRDDAVGRSGMHIAVAVCCLGLAGVRRWSIRAVITPDGIRPYLAAGLVYDRRYPWSEVERVERSGGLFGRRLRVRFAGGIDCVLPVRPVDPDGFREAVERFAGPDHPFTRAVWATTGEGQS